MEEILARVRDERLFSGRKAFLDRVQHLVWQKTEMRVAWPDVLWFVTTELLEQARQDTDRHSTPDA